MFEDFMFLKLAESNKLDGIRLTNMRNDDFFSTSFANIRNKGIDTCFVLCERFTIAIHQENDLCMSLVSLWVLFDRIMFLQSPVHMIQKFNKIGM